MYKFDQQISWSCIPFVALVLVLFEVIVIVGSMVLKAEHFLFSSMRNLLFSVFWVVHFEYRSVCIECLQSSIFLTTVVKMQAVHEFIFNLASEILRIELFFYFFDRLRNRL